MTWKHWTAMGGGLLVGLVVLAYALDLPPLFDDAPEAAGPAPAAAPPTTEPPPPETPPTTTARSVVDVPPSESTTTTTTTTTTTVPPADEDSEPAELAEDSGAVEDVPCWSVTEGADVFSDFVLVENICVLDDDSDGDGDLPGSDGLFGEDGLPEGQASSQEGLVGDDGLLDDSGGLPGVDPSAGDPFADPFADPLAGDPFADPFADPLAGDPFADPFADPLAGDPFADPFADPLAGDPFAGDDPMDVSGEALAEEPSVARVGWRCAARTGRLEMFASTGRQPALLPNGEAVVLLRLSWQDEPVAPSWEILDERDEDGTLVGKFIVYKGLWQPDPELDHDRAGLPVSETDHPLTGIQGDAEKLLPEDEETTDPSRFDQRAEHAQHAPHLVHAPQDTAGDALEWLRRTDAEDAAMHVSIGSVQVTFDVSGWEDQVAALERCEYSRYWIGGSAAPRAAGPEAGAAEASVGA